MGSEPYIFNEDCKSTMISLRNIDLILFSPPYNLGKEYEKKYSLNDYLNWMTDIILPMYDCLSENGQICVQVGNYVEKGRVFPLDCMLFNKFYPLMHPRNRIIWHFGHGLHCKNRFSGRHETILWFSKSDKYTFNLDPIRIPSKYPNKKHFKGDKKGQLSGNPLGKNPSDVWDIPNVKHNHPEKTYHPCQFPEELVRRLILSLTNTGDKVYDPFGGSGTTVKVAYDLGRIGIMSELREDYCKIANDRVSITPPPQQTKLNNETND